MDIDEIKRNLREYIVERFAVPSDDAEFTEDVHLFDYGYVDSLRRGGARGFRSGNRFGVVVSQSDLMVYPMNTINEIADLRFAPASEESFEMANAHRRPRQQRLNESVGQIRYALTFLSEDVVSYDIDEVERKIRHRLPPRRRCRRDAHPHRPAVAAVFRSPSSG